MGAKVTREGGKLRSGREKMNVVRKTIAGWSGCGLVTVNSGELALNECLTCASYTILL